ncbi:hypothetical protein ASPCAL11357 [Aspergillus calidoustus]|uniref:C2H2-type domain-containing protein n=1 Tax=Aspergillus calidoustus TaxID=454130 RepID=A0A0U5GC16_ASPCI|nr:hypothetical protein ASPCAL11357 [Aspergillus calidoustus]
MSDPPKISSTMEQQGRLPQTTVGHYLPTASAYELYTSTPHIEIATTLQPRRPLSWHNQPGGDPGFPFWVPGAEAGGAIVPWSPHEGPGTGATEQPTQGAQSMPGEPRVLVSDFGPVDGSLPRMAERALQEPGHLRVVVSSGLAQGTTQTAVDETLIGSSSAPTHPTQPTTPSLQCRWQDCTSSATFRREADLLRLVKTVHVSRDAYRCPESHCDRTFGRRDHLRAHRRNRHAEGGDR